MQLSIALATVVTVLTITMPFQMLEIYSKFRYRRNFYNLSLMAR